MLSLLLALIVAGPTCWCQQADAKPVAPLAAHDCCQKGKAGAGQAAHERTSAPDVPCSCNKCLVKRDLASSQVQAPAIAWAMLHVEFLNVRLLFRDVPTSAPRPVTDTGPPHERQSILARHCALLL